MIQRYDAGGYGTMDCCDTGEYITYADHIAALTAAVERIKELENENK